MQRIGNNVSISQRRHRQASDHCSWSHGRMSGHGSNYNKKLYELPQAVRIQKNVRTG